MHSQETPGLREEIEEDREITGRTGPPSLVSPSGNAHWAQSFTELPNSALNFAALLSAALALALLPAALALALLSHWTPYAAELGHHLYLIALLPHGKKVSQFSTKEHSRTGNLGEEINGDAGAMTATLAPGETEKEMI